MKLKYLLLASAMYFSTNYAQVKTAEPATTSPSKIRVYTPATSSVSKSKDNSYKWAVKTDFFSMLGGEFPLIGEYRFSPKFSVEASLGMTYAFLPNEKIFGTDDSNSENFESKAAMGGAYRAAIKFYPSSDYDALEGWNFGLQLFSKTLNRDYIESTDYDFSGLQNTKNKTGIALIIGYQSFADSNVTWEYFFGVGIAKVTREFYDSVAVDGQNFYLSPFKTEESVPNFQLGCRIGFGN